ncbi:unnamed protein product [Phytophthora fragariaefolia]|uniref:Unnamed protein product n=1 Tax=Phytophthora fragariaefolia TaxID=1490495 RepID=A0A9W6TSF2_9STRA|nr:unnamed protein product [Phytophthora fragariaefolia]
MRPSVASTPTRTPPIMLQDVYVGKLVAFSPDKERWMKSRIASSRALWSIISVGVVQLGIKHYVALTRVKNPDWRVLVRPDPTDDIDFEEEDSDCDEEEVLEVFDPTELLPTSLAEVEAIRSMRFIPSGEVEAPSYLYTHEDGSTQSYLRPEFKHLFEHSASSSFFAYVPLYFWRQVLHETNKYAVVNNISMVEASMQITGGLQAEDLIFGGATSSLDGFMTLHRFKLLRRCLSFNAVPTTLDEDAAARIRPLLNLLKITGGRYLHVGRDVALDEASVACRSRQGRHMIVYTPMKPTGKYHFWLYMVCCSTTWIALNYKLHCNRSDILNRLGGVVDPLEAQSLREELNVVSKIRQHVLEVTRPLFGTNRIINMDIYYTSIQLLQELRLKGLYGRGTIRATSKHFPFHTILHKDDCVRGEYRQAVSHDHSILAASWCDGNVVNLVSNAESTKITTVTRLIGSEKQPFSAPECVAQYNTNMQGVDRLDQIRGRFSTADGHSGAAARDPHRMFLMELVGELLNGQWKNAPSDGRMLFSGGMLDDEEAD